MPYFLLVDSFDETIGVNETTLADACDRIMQMGEDAGGMQIVESHQPADADTKIKTTQLKLTGRLWLYDFVNEVFVEAHPE